MFISCKCPRSLKKFKGSFDHLPTGPIELGASRLAARVSTWPVSDILGASNARTFLKF